MDNDLKKENNRNIFLIMAASLVVSVFIQSGAALITSLVDAIVAGSGGLLLSSVLLMLVNIIPQNIKHKLVFTRFKNEMPACRVHELCRKDPRVEYDVLVQRWPDVFSDSIDDNVRNSRWYQQIYKPVKDTKSVLQVHRTFLLYRDAFSGLALIFLATVVWSQIGNPQYIGEIKPVTLLVQGGLVGMSLIAARFAGNRFVVNAVAVAV